MSSSTEVARSIWLIGKRRRMPDDVTRALVRMVLSDAGVKLSLARNADGTTRIRVRLGYGAP